MKSESLLAFGEYRLDAVSGHLYRGAVPMPLTPKAFSLLQYLAERAGRLVPKQELLDAVWPGVFVGDAVLKVTIREVRKSLDDDPRTPRFIETAHRRGYRFMAPVTGNEAAPGQTGGRRLPRPRPGCRPAQRRAPRQLRAERERQHRLPGRGLRPDRSRVRHGLGLAPRVLLERAVVRAVPRTAGVDVAPDPVRQARDGAVRSGARRAASHARAAAGRRAGGDGRGGIGARRRCWASPKAARCAACSRRRIRRRPRRSS